MRGWDITLVTLRKCTLSFKRGIKILKEVLASTKGFEGGLGVHQALQERHGSDLFLLKKVEVIEKKVEVIEDKVEAIEKKVEVIEEKVEAIEQKAEKDVLYQCPIDFDEMLQAFDGEIPKPKEQVEQE